MPIRRWSAVGLTVMVTSIPLALMTLTAPARATVMERSMDDLHCHAVPAHDLPPPKRLISTGMQAKPRPCIARSWAKRRTTQHSPQVWSVRFCANGKSRMPHPSLVPNYRWRQLSSAAYRFG